MSPLHAKNTNVHFRNGNNGRWKLKQFGKITFYCFYSYCEVDQKEVGSLLKSRLERLIKINHPNGQVIYFL